MTQDLRFALRRILKSPGFTGVVLLTLGLGIGANTAIFSLMDQVLLRLLPVRNPEELVVLDAPGPFSGSTHNYSATLTPISHPMFEALRDKNTVFDGLLAHCPAQAHLTANGETSSVDGDLVSGTFFEVLGLAPAAGRLFTPEDDRRPGAHPIMVLSHGFWTRRFAADPDVVGQSVLLNSQPMTVVGVAPAGFHGVELGGSPDVFVPLMMQPQVIPTWNGGIGEFRVRWLTAMARLKEGVSISQAKAGIEVLYRQILEEDLKRITTSSERFRARFLEKQITLLPGGGGTSELRGQSRTPLLVLTGMVGLVLLIACANVANLLLARASSRQRELAVRLALGASRGRLVRQLLAESLVLSIGGGLVGIVLASWTGDLLLNTLVVKSAARALSADLDLRVGGFAFGLSLATTFVFGLVPALQSTRPALAPTLKSEASSIIGGRAPQRFRKGLVAAQVALSLLLLIGAGLFARSLMNLRRLDPGFQPDRLLAFSVDPSLNGYTLERRVELLKRIRDEIAAEPGVRSVSLAELALMTRSDSSSTVSVEGYEPKEGENMNPNFNGLAPGFFETLGIPLLAGRDFTEADGAGAPKVAVVNQTFARYFFGNGDPLDRRFGYSRGPKDVTIVGVVKDGKSGSLQEEPLRFVYTPYMQSGDLGGATFYVRSDADLTTLGARLGDLVRRVDATLPVTEMKTMREQIGDSLLVERMVASLSGAFGLLATLLAAVGLYGVTSQAVALRTREIGIRVALGAERRNLLSMVLKDVAMLAALGTAIGLPAGYALGRLVESQLFGLSARDPLTFAAATCSLLLAALLAGYVPAARVTRIDPVEALRYE